MALCRLPHRGHECPRVVQGLVGGGVGLHARDQDGIYEYTGEGQVGDQVMTRGNRAIRDHAENGKRLRLFQGARGEVRYLGEYEYLTHRTERVPASRGHGDRDVFVFQLRPVSA